jgi:hypothetical protein
MKPATEVRFLTDIDAHIEHTLALIATNPEGNARVYAEIFLSDLRARRAVLRCLWPHVTEDRYGRAA